MRVVLYAQDMEPITVLELHEFAVRHLQQHGIVSLAVLLPPLMSAIAAMEPVDKGLYCKTVCITSETLILRGEEHMLLFTADEESAMLLESAFLPGQRRGLHEKQREAFAQGFLHALHRMGQI